MECFSSIQLHKSLPGNMSSAQKERESGGPTAYSTVWAVRLSKYFTSLKDKLVQNTASPV